GFVNPKIFLVSINNKSSIKRLHKYLSTNYTFKKILFLGKTNVGKSSLINELCKLEGTKSKLLISAYTNTTISFKQIKFDKFTIIDSPGVIDNSNVCNYLSSKDIKKIILNKPIRPRNYFLNINQTIMIEKLAFLSYVEGKKTNFTFYCSNEIKLNRIKMDNLERNLFNKNDSIKYIEYQDIDEWVEHKFELESNKKYNLTIVGIGLISINFGAQLVKIKVRKDVGVFLNEFAII
ncbi:MAG: 50S ribosome-binding GTPase, partial [Ureaplasma sp.]|nr:50S ribosome-binding GTPase [Ureaplasma sp.]